MPRTIEPQSLTSCTAGIIPAVSRRLYLSAKDCSGSGGARHYSDQGSEATARHKGRAL